MDKLAGYLQRAHQILVFTGAGISTASGIPDFRGPQGVWSRRKPVYYQEFMTSEAARVEHWDYKLGSVVFNLAGPAKRSAPRHCSARTSGQDLNGRYPRTSMGC